MNGDERTDANADGGVKRRVPIAWEALEDAFENNAPEVHSYLQLATGEVIRVVDGIADPVTHTRISTDPGYLRIDPVSSREQYRWMERFIVSVDPGPLRDQLQQAIDGKGAFRRFKDVLMGFPVERERWFQFRSERLRSSMEAWLDAQGVEAIDRPEWSVPSANEVKAPEVEAATPVRARKAPTRTLGATDVIRRKLHEIVDALPSREVETALAFLEFLTTRRASPRVIVRGGGDPSEGGSSRVG